MTEPPPAHVLIIDDDAIWTRTMLRALEAYGLEVDEAHSIEEALSVSAVIAFDAVLLDLSMGDVYDPPALVAQVSERFPSYVPIIILTGREDPDEGLWFSVLAAGAHDWRSKPTSVPEIVDLVLAIRSAIVKAKSQHIRSLRL